MTWGDDYDAAKVRFWEHLTQLFCGRTETQDQSNPEAYVLFWALDHAFGGADSENAEAKVDHRIIQYLSGWGQASLREEQRGGVIGPNANHFLSRVYEGLFQTIRDAIKEDRLRYYDETTIMFDCLRLPQWLVDMWRAEAKAEAEHVRQMRIKHPGFRKPHLVHSE